jgi:Mn2+/Fe2+ NRAMP family transporter
LAAELQFNQHDMAAPSSVQTARVPWKHGLHARPSEAKAFYGLIAGFTIIAMCMNFFGFNAMKALVFAGVVQGFSTPPPMFLIMRMTGNRAIMGEAVNGRGISVLGWTTTAAIFAATGGLVYTWII